MQKAHEIACRLGAQAEAVCRHYLPNGRRQGRYWLVGDVMGTPGRSLYVRLSDERAGKWTDAATGEHGDLLDLIALNRGLDFRAALEEARDFLRLPMKPQAGRAEVPAPAGSPACAKPGLRSGEGRPEAARRLFAASQPVAGTLAERYLRHRGIILPADLRALRFHPRCYYRGRSGRQTWPALIAAVTDLDGNLTGIHRTWLDPSGLAKAPVEQPRRAMGHLIGNGVRFSPARDVLTAGEGIETTLALKTIMPAMSMIAALSAAHLSALMLPPGLRRLCVARDNDEAGRLALAKLCERGEQTGIDVRPLVPRAEDFNADLLTLGPDRLRAWLADQLAEEDIPRFLTPASACPA